MKLLGAVLCGGQSSRFGSDKSQALLRGTRLIDHVRAALSPQVSEIALCGPGGIADRPHPGLGPLAGIAGALASATTDGFDAVLSVPCDTPILPRDLAARLAGQGATIVAECPVIGWWPITMLPALDTYLANDSRRSARGFARCVGAVTVSIGPVANVNARGDLDALAVDEMVVDALGLEPRTR